ncbi:MAG: serine hydrolase [Chitinophagaceae bacterium]|nr:serine hydrolase [Chitinophagaceae bacterium]
MIKTLLLLFSVFMVSICLRAQTSATPAFISDSLNKYIEQGMKDWNIPGLAIAIVKDGKVVLMKGFGVRDIESKEPIDENTLFMIASNSKLFTGTALSQLEYNNKLNLNDLASKYINGYALYDKNTSDLVTIRDLLSHRIGTKTFQGDFIFWNGKLSRGEIMNKMKLLKPSGIFRQSFGYCNSCFLTAGEVIPVVTGKPWEVYVYDSIILPLGLTNTHMLSQGFIQRNNVSKPYTTLYTGKVTELPYDQVDNLGPAGSMVSNVNDLSKWLLMQLDSGRLNGNRILAWDVLRKTRDMNIAISSRKSNTLPIHYTGYGLGVFMNDYAGKQVFYHTGGAFGFVTNTCFVPEEKLGIVILTNNDNQNFFEALRYQVLDAYLNVPYVNRSKNSLAGFNKEMVSTVSETATMKSRVKSIPPPLALNNYTGIYKNELYGNIEIIKDKSGKFLNIDFKGHNKLKATLEYMDNNEWLLTYNNIAYGIFPVKFKSNGGVQSIEISVNDFLDYDTYTFFKN